MSWDRGDCGYCHLPILSGSSYHPDKDGDSYHMEDCWPRERFNRDGTPFVTCKYCGKADAAMYMDKVRDRMIAMSLCFTCNFWEEWVERTEVEEDKPNIARINGNHYYIGDENSKSGFRGFGGTPHTIAFNDGREVRTTNLWYQGEVPERFRERLPDNATFVARETEKRTSARFVLDRTLVQP